MTRQKNRKLSDETRREIRYWASNGWRFSFAPTYFFCEKDGRQPILCTSWETTKAFIEEDEGRKTLDPQTSLF